MNFLDKMNEELNEAKKVAKNNKVDPVLDGIKKGLNDLYGCVNIINYTKDGGIRITCYPGSSVKRGIKQVIKKLGLDLKYDINNIDFMNWGDDHVYDIPLKPQLYKPIKTVKTSKKATIEEIAAEAQYQADKWMPEVDFDEFDQMSKSDLKVQIEGLVDAYIEEYYSISSFDIEENQMAAIKKAIVKKLIANFS